MKFSKTRPLVVLLALASTHCGQAPSHSSSCSTSFSGSSYPTLGSYTTGANVMPVTVNGGLCGARNYQYPNEPCVSVTICSPLQPYKCQTINNLLLDTGSVGLRVFSSLLTIPLVPITNGSENLAECVQYGDGSSQWGQIAYAYVQLGDEPVVGTPIMVINSKYSTPPALCTARESIPDINPQAAGFNGILGVGLFKTDCGSECLTNAQNGQYYSCNSSDCACGAKVDISAQVQNIVALLPKDNNGVILSLPSVSATGANSVTGTLTLGIGTQANNTPTGVSTYPTDRYGNFSTLFSAYSPLPMTGSFIDSGSSDYFFPAPINNSLPDCSLSHGTNWNGFYCPSTAQNLSAITTSARGVTSGTISFQIDNFYNLINTGNYVFNNAGTSVSSAYPYFDWGLPFFLGRTVYVGIDGSSSTLGTGPYWAY